jgi:hypothetical protein
VPGTTEENAGRPIFVADRDQWCLNDVEYPYLTTLSEALADLQSGGPPIRLAVPSDGRSAIQQHGIGRTLISNRIYTLLPLLDTGVIG